MTNALQSHVPPVEPQIIPAPPLRIVMVKEPAKSVLAKKHAFHDFVIFHAFPERYIVLQTRNQSSNHRLSGQGRGVHSSLMLSTAWASIAAKLAAASDWAITPESGSPGEYSASEVISPHSDAVIDSSSTSQALNEKVSSPLGKAPNSSGGHKHAVERLLSL